MKRKEKGCHDCDLMPVMGKSKNKIKKKERMEEFVPSKGCRMAFSAEMKQ